MSLDVGERGSSGVCSVFSIARKPHNNHACEEAQYYLCDYRHDEIANAIASLSFKNNAIHGMAYDAGKEHHKGIYYALYERECNHVAVGHVTDLMSKDCTNFIGLKAP